MRTRIAVVAFVALLLSTVAHAAEITVLSTQGPGRFDATRDYI